MSDGDELPTSADTYRVPAATLVYAPQGEILPTHAAFALSSLERDARARGEVVRVSVWDARKISSADAKAQRAGNGICYVFTLSVDAVNRIAKAQMHPGLRVVEDRAGAPPSAPQHICEAHAGIEGLAVEPAGVRLKSIRAKLAEACRLCDTERAPEGVADRR